MADFNFKYYEDNSGLDPHELMRMKSVGCNGDINKYAAALYILNKGHDALGNTFSVTIHFPPCSISEKFYKDFIDKDGGILKACNLLKKAVNNED